MTGLTAAVGTLAVLAGLVVIVAATVAFFRASYARATIDTLRDSNTALTSRVTELEADNGRQAVKIEHLENEAVALRSYVAGTEAVRELEKALMARLDAIGKAVGIRGSEA